MPSYYDENQKTWYCKFYYTDWTGQRKQKLKRGFPRQRDAKDWERDFLQKQQGSPDMPFQTLYDLYVEDIEQHLKDSTVTGRKYRCERNILPYFKDKPINQIKAADIRKWQGIIVGKGFKPTYQKALNEQLSIIFNFARKYYGLKENPCLVPGQIGTSKARRMDFWTQADFNAFIHEVDKADCKMAFTMLYYTGLRSGELLALTLQDLDLDLDSPVLSVNKTYRRDHKSDIITSPKTSNSIRAVTLPPFLASNLKEYIGTFHNLQPTDRLFPFTYRRLERYMNQACEKSGIKRIRIHDIRHSHVSLLIELGFTPLLIAERIGDTVDMVNNIYGHLDPNKHKDVAEKLQMQYQSSITA